MTAHKYAIQSLTDAVMSFQLEAIPADVLNLAKRSLIDVCGVTLAGAFTEISLFIIDLIPKTEAVAPETVV